MPKTSKVHKSAPKQHTPKPTSSQPGDPAPQQERDAFYCCRCGKKYNKQNRNFPASQSTLYRGNGGYLPVCSACLDELYEHYKLTLGSDEEAIKRLCLKFDIYWHPSIYDITLNAGGSATSRIRNYISRTNLYRFIGKTFDNTLDEMSGIFDYDKEIEIDENKSKSDSAPERVVKFENVRREPKIITEEIQRYWGSGFTPDMYADLEDRREYWLSKYPEWDVLDPGLDMLLKQICNLEIEINAARVAEKPIERMVSTLNNLIGSMNLKPSQKKEAEEQYIPFGVEIAKWEQEKPVIEPDEDFKDVDNLHKNVIAWFLGSLCKTVGIKNKYSEVFDEEIAKYTVERPEYDDEDVLSEV